MIADKMRCISGAMILVCGFATAAWAETIISNDDNGKNVSVPQGTPLVINLTGKHGTGYYWRIDTDPTPQLVLSGRTTHSVAVDGAPETTSFTYTTGAAGPMMFRASYLQANAPIPDKSDIAILIEVTPPQ